LVLKMPSFSKFKLTDPILTIDNQETFGLMKKFRFLDRESLEEDEIEKIFIDGTRVGRPDLIALDLYESSIHFWILLMFNNVMDPFGWPKNQTVIEAPIRSVVFRELT